MQKCAVMMSAVFGAAAAMAVETCYVNINNYDPTRTSDYCSKDGCDGSTYEKGFGTLAKASRWTNGRESGGCRVLVGPGVYTNLAYGSNSARFQVRENVTAESMEGPEKTIIVGAASTNESADAYGNGPGYVRCVEMSKNAVLRGFTLTGGHTENTMDSNKGYGGAVQSKNGQLTTLVANCIITNNYSAQSVLFYSNFDNCIVKDNHSTSRWIIEGAKNVTNCRVSDNTGNGGCGATLISESVFFGNSVTQNLCQSSKYVNSFFTNNVCAYYDNEQGAVLYGGAAINCFVSDNTACRSAARLTQTVNCTFGPFKSNHPTQNAFAKCGFWDQRGPIANTIFLTRPDGQQHSNILYMTNCFCISYPAHSNVAVNCKEIKTAAAMGLDANYRPVKGGEAVGAGSNEFYTAVASDVGCTLDGVPRILNGNIDLGAYEYDWREDFAAALGPDVVVTNASSTVTLTSAGKVEIPTEAALAGYLKEKAGATRYALTTVSGTPSGTFYPANKAAVAVSASTLTGISRGALGFNLLPSAGSLVLNDFLRTVAPGTIFLFQ